MRADYTRVASLRPRVAKKSRWRGQTITSRIALACDAALGIRAASVVTDKENADRENKLYAYQIAMVSNLVANPRIHAPHSSLRVVEMSMRRRRSSRISRIQDGK